MRSIGKIRFSKAAFTDLFSTSKAPPSVLCFLVLGKYAANCRLKLKTWIVVLYLHDRSTKTTVKSVQKEPEPYFFIINAPGVFRQAPGADFTSLLRIFLKLIRSCLVYIIVQPVAIKRIGHISPGQGRDGEGIVMVVIIPGKSWIQSAVQIPVILGV